MERKRKRKTAVEAESKIQITVKSPFADPETQEQVIETHQFQTDPAYIRVGYGRTISTADYETLKVDVSVSVPCYPEQVEDVISDVRSLVLDELEDSIAAWEEDNA